MFELNPDLDACTATKLNNIFAVIAAPFTSVVHFSIKNKLPTIYFNPSKKVVLSQGNKRKIKMITSQNSLESWINSKKNFKI